MKTNLKIFFLLLLLPGLCASCSRPRGVLSEKKMTEVIFDIMMAEGTMYAAGITYKIEEKEKYYNSVYEKHNITAEQLDKSFTYYTKNPKKLETIYGEVNKRFKEMDEELGLQEEKEKREKEIQDSLRMVEEKRLKDSIRALDIDTLKRDSLLTLMTDSLRADSLALLTDSINNK